MDIKQLEARIQALENDNTKLKDAEEIKKLQRIYGYYIERGQLDEVADLFSDNTEVRLEMPPIKVGMSKNISTGKENVKKMFSSKRPFGVVKGPKPKNYLHITMPVSGVVDVNTDGKTAKGRWYALMYLCNAGMGGGAVLGVGVYENDYIKEKGKWKILTLRFDDIFLTPYEDGWAKTPKIRMVNTGVESDLSFGEQIPFHYKHPITGKVVQ